MIAFDTFLEPCRLSESLYHLTPPCQLDRPMKLPFEISGSHSLLTGSSSRFQAVAGAVSASGRSLCDESMSRCFGRCSFLDDVLDMFHDCWSLGVDGGCIVNHLVITIRLTPTRMHQKKDQKSPNCGSTRWLLEPLDSFRIIRRRNAYSDIESSC